MEDLRTKYDLLLAIIDGTDDVAFVMDLQDRYVFINSAGVKFFDIPLTEIIGKTNKELFPPEAANKIMEYNQKVISSGKAIEAEESVEINGRAFTFFSRKAPYHDVKGNIIGIVCITRDVTERKKAEKRLMESEQRLSYALDASNDGIWDWNVITGEVRFSKNWCKSLGYNPEEVVGHVSFWENIIHPDDKKHTMKALDDYFQGKTKIYEVENRLRMKSGTYRYNLDTGKVVKSDNNGNPIRMIGTDKDITKRKNAEESLKNYTYLINQSNDAIYVIEPETSRFLYFNDKAITSLGYGREELLNMGVLDVEALLPDLSSWKQQVNELKEKTCLSFEGTVKRNDGTVFPVEINAKYITHETQNYIIAVVRDITVRKKVEEERDRFFNKSIDMLCIAGFDGNFKQLNPAWTFTLGWSIDELLSHPWLSFVHPDDQQSTIEVGKQLQNGKSVIEFENRYQCKDGTYRWISWNSFPILEKKQIFAVARDITQRKRMEEESAIYQKKLKHFSSVLSLTEERERRQIAEDLHDRIGQTQAVIKMKLEELRNIQDNTDSERILNETSGLLDNVIQNTRTLTFEISPPILYELGFESAVEWLIEQFKERYNIPIEYENKGGDGNTLDDDVSFFLFKSIRELLFNVIKHARADRIKVSVRREENSIRISIQDDGVGFDFSKVQFSVNSLSGFGLFSMRERMEHFGGNLDVKSKPGKGTRITLVMSLKPQEEDWVKWIKR
jgi:PAS domain S-box-containing protein